MAGRMTPSQIRSQLQRTQQQQRQAMTRLRTAAQQYDREMKRLVDNHNRGVREHKRAVDDYNRAARAHNAKVRANRERLRRELAKLSSTTPTTHATYRASVESLQRSLVRIESAADAGNWTGDTMLLDLSEGEAANSVAALNALVSRDEITADDVASDLQATGITDQLAQIDPELDERWRGALFALHPRNPDAARHFCTSSREILGTILEREAPDAEVKMMLTDYTLTDQGRVSRRSKVRYCLARRGSLTAELEDFVEHDLDNVLALFHEFNDGTHGTAGHFTLSQLITIKKRVEDAIVFLYAIVR